MILKILKFTHKVLVENLPFSLCLLHCNWSASQKAGAESVLSPRLAEYPCGVLHHKWMESSNWKIYLACQKSPQCTFKNWTTHWRNYKLGMENIAVRDLPTLAFVRPTSADRCRPAACGRCLWRALSVRHGPARNWGRHRADAHKANSGLWVAKSTFFGENAIAE